MKLTAQESIILFETDVIPNAMNRISGKMTLNDRLEAGVIKVSDAGIIDMISHNNKISLVCDLFL